VFIHVDTKFIITQKGWNRDYYTEKVKKIGDHVRPAKADHFFSPEALPGDAGLGDLMGEPMDIVS
jgi:hypothetical protein